MFIITAAAAVIFAIAVAFRPRDLRRENSGAPLKWAFASSEAGQISLISDFFTRSYIDRGYRQALSFRREVAQAYNIGEDQATD